LTTEARVLRNGWTRVLLWLSKVLKKAVEIRLLFFLTAKTSIYIDIYEQIWAFKSSMTKYTQVYWQFVVFSARDSTKKHSRFGCSEHVSRRLSSFGDWLRIALYHRRYISTWLSNFQNILLNFVFLDELSSIDINVSILESYARPWSYIWLEFWSNRTFCKHSYFWRGPFNFAPLKRTFFLFFYFSIWWRVADKPFFRSILSPNHLFCGKRKRRSPRHNLNRNFFNGIG
jgi:hypothetical protein